MNTPRILLLLLVLCAANLAKAQSQSPPKAQLRFDQAQREQVAQQAMILTPEAVQQRVACKLNRRRVSWEQAYDAVTLWNVRHVRVKERSMRLSDSTGRERVQLLKFRIEKNRKKNQRPHLLGNVGGAHWSTFSYDPATRRRRSVKSYVSRYTLRSDYDSLRQAMGGKMPAHVPDELWRELTPDSMTFVLNGARVSGALLQFIDGLVLRTMDIFTGSEARARGYAGVVVIGDTYPDRVPLVILNGELSSLDAWLRLLGANAFAVDAAVPMQYYYMLPVEAVQHYGVAGKYGAIVVGLVYEGV